MRLNELHNALAEARQKSMWSAVCFEVNGETYYVNAHSYGLSVSDGHKQLFVVRFKHYRDYYDDVKTLLNVMLSDCYTNLITKLQK